MPIYDYTAKTLKGEDRNGATEAKDEHDLARILHQEELVLISAELQGGQKSENKFSISIPFLNRIKLVDKIMFTRNLQVMVSAGIALPKAMVLLSEQTTNKKFKDILLQISDQVSRGKTFSESIAAFPKVFSDLFVNLVKVGEEAGTLESVLGNLTSQLEKDYDLRSKVKGAMVYPAVILSAMLLIGFLMLVFVVPKLSQTFNDLNVTLPITTRIMIGMGAFTSKYWYVVIIGAFGLISLVRFLLKTKPGKVLVDNFLLKMPMIAPIVKKTNAAYTVRTLGSLISSGVPIIRALEITGDTLSNGNYKRILTGAAEEVQKGGKLSGHLAKYPGIYPPLVSQMIAIGEETGQTGEMLSKLAEFYEEEVNRITKNLATVIEPFLMLIIGGAVAFFAISMFQPIYGMMGTFSG